MTNQAACSEAAEISKRLDLTACVYRLLNLVPRLISSFCTEIKEKPGNIGRFKPLSLTLSSSDGLAASNQITAFHKCECVTVQAMVSSGKSSGENWFHSVFMGYEYCSCNHKTHK